MNGEAYLDANAGMRLRPEAREALLRALDLSPGNPSSAHAAGRRARRALSEAREAVAALAGARPREVVFTSGATEANVLALRGALAAAPPGRTSVVTTRAEHPSILRLAERLEQEGVRVLRAPADARGRVAVADVARLADTGTAITSVVLAQSVTGAVQPVAEAAPALRAAGVFVHTDAAQAAGRIPLSLRELGVDAMSLSAPKLGGPPGAGALVLRDGAPWRAPHGEGAQEGGRRPGTEAVALLAAFGAAAAAAAADLADFAARAARLLAPVREFVAAAPGGEVVSPASAALPNTLLVAFDGCPGASVVAALDAEGVRVSSGTACASLARTPAEVLLAGGRTPEDAARAVRISVAWDTREDDVARLLGVLRDAIPRVRAAHARR